MSLKVYLAGKVDEHGAWRDAIMPPVYDYKLQRRVPVWEVAHRLSDRWDLDDIESIRWPREPNTLVLGLHEYVGPYRTTYLDPQEGGAVVDSKYSGYFHGSLVRGQHGQPDESYWGGVVGECAAAIGRADIVFAYLNTPDCFGTLAEIGMARALGKFVYVAAESDAEWDWSDYWFVSALADWTGHEWQVFGDVAPVDHGVRALAFFRDALIRWTARPPMASPSLVPVLIHSDPPGSIGLSITRDLVPSYSQIARWTSDPRVREEARRMLSRMGFSA